MLLRPAEFTHASEKLEFTTKGFGASGAGRSLRRCRCPYHFVGWAAVANQLAAAWMWLAGAMPLNTVHSNSLLYFSVILRNPWFSLGNNRCFWKENEKLYCENYWQCFRKNDEGGLFPLMAPFAWDLPSWVDNCQNARGAFQLVTVQFIAYRLTFIAYYRCPLCKVSFRTTFGQLLASFRDGIRYPVLWPWIWPPRLNIRSVKVESAAHGATGKISFSLGSSLRARCI